MYKVLLDGVEVINSQVPAQVLVDPVVIQEANAAGSFEFGMLPDHPNYNDIILNKTLIEVMKSNGPNKPFKTVFRGFAVSVNTNIVLIKKFYCEGILASLNDTILRQAHIVGYTNRQLLETYINIHNSQIEEAKRFEIGRVDNLDDYITCYTNMEPTISAIKSDLLDDLGGYLTVDYTSENTLNYTGGALRHCSQVVRLGENLLDFDSNIDNTEIATCVIPLGETLEEQEVPGLEKRLDITSVNDGKDYLINEERLAYLGYKAAVVIWDEVTTPEALKRKGQKFLEDIQFDKVVITVNAVDLSMIQDADDFRLLDEVRFIADTHGMDKDFIITKITNNLNNPEFDMYTFGSPERNAMTAQSNRSVVSLQKTNDIRDAAINSVNARTVPVGNGYTMSMEAKNASVAAYTVGDEVQVNGYIILESSACSSAWVTMLQGLPGARYEIEAPACDAFGKTGGCKMTTDGNLQLFVSGAAENDIIRFNIRYLKGGQ